MRFVVLVWLTVLTRYGTFICDQDRLQCPITPDNRWVGIWWTNQDGVRCNDAGLGSCLTITLNNRPVGTLVCKELGLQVWQCGDLSKEE